MKKLLPKLARRFLVFSILALAAGLTTPPIRAQDSTIVNPHGTGSNPHDSGPNPHATGTAGSMLPFPGPVPAGSLAKVGIMESVPVMHDGRLKPMVTFARHMLLQFSGKTTYQGLSAMQVMAKILFAPETTGDLQIFLINNPEVPQALGIPDEKHRRYSFRMLEKGLPKLEQQAQKASEIEAEKRDLVQKEILRTFSNVVDYLNLTRSFTFALPNSMFTVRLPETKSLLGLKPDQSVFSFWDLMSRAQAIAQVLEGLGERPDSERTAVEKEIINLSQAMYLNAQSAFVSPFRIFPVPAGGHSGNAGWQSPSEIIASPGLLQSFHAEISAWAQAVAAYRMANPADFEKGLKDYLGSMENRAYEQLSKTKFPLEIIYQKGEPFYWSLVAYWLALLGIFGFFLIRKAWLYHATVYVFLAGFLVHILGIVSRVLIMNRPPVTSLYETFPFVASVSILAALFIERLNRKRASAGIGLLCAALIGTILLSIANRYAAEGDTMNMLVAVLNSNFWLSTHVVTVTIGYSACLLAGAIGHIWLIRALIPGDESKSERLKEIAKMVYGTLCFGLLFSFIGTVLGGIWADQSWGRFWGWDPKENGALLIVVWCILLLHAKQWGYIRNPGLALGSVFGAIVVSLAWFGVNLLNVGLHSYGFTTGAAAKLFIYVGGELLFMVITGAGYYLGLGNKLKKLPE
jgi:ABC-type transport system involved in cytochrome c biogenesis permease subunit